jgi:hypothetical protein
MCVLFLGFSTCGAGWPRIGQHEYMRGRPRKTELKFTLTVEKLQKKLLVSFGSFVKIKTALTLLVLVYDY